MTAKTPAERQRKKRRGKKARGLWPVESWVPKDKVWAMKELEKRLCEWLQQSFLTIRLLTRCMVAVTFLAVVIAAQVPVILFTFPALEYCHSSIFDQFKSDLWTDDLLRITHFWDNTKLVLRHSFRILMVYCTVMGGISPVSPEQLLRPKTIDAYSAFRHIPDPIKLILNAYVYSCVPWPCLIWVHFSAWFFVWQSRENSCSEVSLLDALILLSGV